MKNQLNMLWGNCDFLSSYWKNRPLKIDISEELRYQDSPLVTLPTYIQLLHHEIQNCEYLGKHLVIGNGASQLISAAIYALNSPVYCKPPHFSRFPILANLGGQYLTEVDHPAIPKIVTLPNNPDNSKENISTNGFIIADLCYNWPMYTEKVEKYNFPIMIFSLSKATGHAATRFGWAWVENKEIADKMKQFIEFNTCGVSVDSQEKANAIIKNQLDNEDNVFKWGRTILTSRWETIKVMKTPFEILNSDGMFLWCKGEKPNDILFLNGSNFGVDDSYFRLNLGVDSDTFNEFYNRFKV